MSFEHNFYGYFCLFEIPIDYSPPSLPISRFKPEKCSCYDSFYLSFYCSIFFTIFSSPMLICWGSRKASIVLTFFSLLPIFYISFFMFGCSIRSHNNIYFIFYITNYIIYSRISVFLNKSSIYITSFSFYFTYSRFSISTTSSTSTNDTAPLFYFFGLHFSTILLKSDS